MPDTTQSILDNIDNVTHPDKMSKNEALKFLKDLHACIEGRCEALEAEIDEEIDDLIDDEA